MTRDAGAGAGSRELVRDLSFALRERVLPWLGARAGREHAGGGDGKDITFAIDEAAESFLESFIAKRAPGVAFYSEDRGMVRPGRAAGAAGDGELVLIVDPVDGTRPAMAGFESACVSVAAARLPAGGPEPTMGDVSLGCIVEIKSGEWFLAERGCGCEASVPLALSPTVDVERMFWVYGLRGRPARATIEVLADLLDASSTSGGTFDLGSATYDMTRVLTGQLDAYIEPSPLLVDEVPGMQEEFERVGGGAVLNNAPYDLAAAVLCLQEGGAVVTDARGRPLDDRPLLGSSHEFQMSCVACANSELHETLLRAVDDGVARVRRAHVAGPN